MKTIYTPTEILQVRLDFGIAPAIPVGRLARVEERIYFEYDPQFVSSGLQISPYKLPLSNKTVSFPPSVFEGLPGVFNDSLPDGWGKLLLDRKLCSLNILPGQFSPLDRLAYVGTKGMGALTCHPDHSDHTTQEPLDLNTLAEHSEKILQGASGEVLEELLRLNGSSSGARPKVLIGFRAGTSEIVQGVRTLPSDFEPWLVKFANTLDGADAGAIEYVYGLMARQAGLKVPDMHLFESKSGPGYFATKRFDWLSTGEKLHTHTACGLLHSDFRIPALDYEDLIKATLWLTKDIREARMIFRYAVFNVLSHNRDDHSKNFSFLMDQQGTWSLAPAYDLTFSSGPMGQQSMLVAGEGQNPTTASLLSLAKHADLSTKDAQQIINEVKSALSQWPLLAKENGVSTSRIQFIKKAILKT
ncbi:MAG: type II toxin-antitoxin system HipA family toxin [Bacteroidetes bacterium]|nr:type II toxin-antitoxin system HipA family toxin [Bacteroidota bacterium]